MKRSDGMRHITIENLMTYLESNSSDVEKSTLETHVAACGDCADLKQEFQNLLFSLKEDASFEPPADIMKWVIDLFQPVMHLKDVVSRFRKFISTLIIYI